MLTFSMAIIPAAATKESVKVDFPAGTEHLQLAYFPLRPSIATFVAQPTVVHMSNDTHVTDVLGKVHELTNLVDSELDHGVCCALTQAISLTVTSTNEVQTARPTDSQ